jgi:hypothetical protein
MSETVLKSYAAKSQRLYVVGAPSMKILCNFHCFMWFEMRVSRHFIIAFSLSGGEKGKDKRERKQEFSDCSYVTSLFHRPISFGYHLNLLKAIA